MQRLFRLFHVHQAADAVAILSKNTHVNQWLQSFVDERMRKLLLLLDVTLVVICTKVDVFLRNHALLESEESQPNANNDGAKPYQIGKAVADIAAVYCYEAK